MNCTNFLLKKNILFSLAVVLCINSLAQTAGENLVPNSSFEIHKNKTGIIKNAIPWEGQGTVDYYLKPEKTDTSRFKGAHTGKCYAGLRFQPNYKEYMYVQLTEPLEKGKTYFFKMYVRLKGISTVTVKQLGVYFSDDDFKIGMSFDDEGVLDSTYSKGLSGALGWIPIQGQYIAEGREKFIVIGNFKTKMKDDFVRLNKWDIFEMREAYYYIDDISVRKKISVDETAGTTKKNEPLAVHTLPDNFTTGQIVEIKNIQFENGTAKLMKRSSVKGLDELVRVLNEHPFMEIQINSHIYNQRTESENKKLSKARAKVLYDYLLEQGIINPAFYKGFGSASTIVQNDTNKVGTKNDEMLELMIIKE
jgi:outer membrane protein OmpA-like peptidoglycan-associated protein